MTQEGSKASHQVVVVGSANIDVIVDVPRRPNTGETILGENLRHAPGGKGANQAVAAARAGGAISSFIGVLGRDESGSMILSSMQNSQVKTDLVSLSSVPTGTALINVTPDGENSIVVASGANSTLEIDRNAQRVIREAGVLLAQLEIDASVVLAAARARRRGSLFVLNAAPSGEIPPELLAEIDLLVVNEHEAWDIVANEDGSMRADIGAGEIGETSLINDLLALVPAVVVTLGSDGAIVAQRDAPYISIPALPSQAVDTTGAGDTFCGVVAAELSAGHHLEEAAQRASAAASLAVTRLGTQDAVPTHAEVEAILKSI